MKQNFEIETMKLIEASGATVVAYSFRRHMDPFGEKGENKIFKGEGNINWEEIPKKFLNYCDGFGTQYWDGVILLSDNTWLTRGEYDGSEWWEHHKLPTVEEILNKEL